MSMERVVVRHGNERFAVDPDHTRIPFHGIVAASLRDAMTPRASRVDEWPRIAPELDRELARPGPWTSRRAPLSAWLDHALRHGVLSYAQSLAAATATVDKWWRHQFRKADAPIPARASQGSYELWSVREGHTSSVWCATLDARDGSRPISLCLNVARDATVAARDLHKIGAALRHAHGRDPRGFLPVLDEMAVGVSTARGLLTVPVLVSPWLDDARELHVVADPDAGAGRWFAVDHFVSVPRSRQRLDGELFTIRRSDEVWRAAVALTVRAADSVCDGFVVGPVIEPNDGDLVGTDDRVVAISVSPPRGPEPLGAWTLRALLPSAGAPELGWQRPDLAAATLCEEVEAHRTLPSISTCLDAARCEARRRFAARPSPSLGRALRVVAGG